MFHSWLDRWDERRAARGDAVKKVTGFALDADLAFPGAAPVESIVEFCDLADQAVAEPGFFDPPGASDTRFEFQDGWLRFPSDMSTDVKENNTVWAKVTARGTPSTTAAVKNAPAIQPKKAIGRFSLSSTRMARRMLVPSATVRSLLAEPSGRFP